ncbi:LipL32 family surface lipoprotein [Flavivirga sp. 57AJ16]|uniref:LipL32 family surface lipoprotein n=1 Tax=Flavivirga sp. 57AJ16 TaxID=3025307 RepID=UPI002366B092|nr:LipL32 family surface lipoprotein [Flavivirga sp. 57AJ16]MDD7884811.1 LipL32 family surface lipoprotein [Flavivirga sp. 57AJ16]
MKIMQVQKRISILILRSVRIFFKIRKDAVKNANRAVLVHNDDSSEMPKQPRGVKYNSLLKYKSVASTPAKALTAGLYRIGFTTYKTGDVKGIFLAQVAAPIKLPGVVMAKTIEDLKNIYN